MRTPLLSPFRKTRPPSEPRIVRAGPSDNLRGTMLMVLSMAAFTCNDAVMKAVTQTLPLYESVALRGMAVLALMVAAALVHDPAVLLLDIKMPRMDGLEVLKQLRNHETLKRMPVVILSSSREESDLARSWDLGVNAYVVKPVDVDQFFGAVRTLGTFWAVINQAPDRE